ncbi:MAG: N-6 DNA methylase, partial [Gemmatimonadales bacterium]|nr:N-6 DNA methylase [Gemmatimonadales bacterium]
MPLQSLLPTIRRLEDLAELAGALGWDRVWRELPPELIGGAKRSVVIARQQAFEWIGAVGPSPKEGIRAARHFRSRGRMVLLLLLDPARRALTVASAEAPPLTISLDAPDALALARLTRCRARTDETALAAAFRLDDALGGRAADERFFAAFRATLGSFMDALPKRLAMEDRHALGLLTLTRLLFLYFVEAKGWLDRRPRFLREEVDRCLGLGRSLHRDLLDPLFFGTLNRPLDQRSALARRFGQVPFLNGGLFEPHPLERRWRVALPTPVLRNAFDDLFERFHFTLTAPGAGAIAPDMLGRVFERVMEPEERHASGSYYTPAALVDALLRDTFAAWLAERLDVGWPEAARRLDEPDQAARAALREIRILDPAAGSGAFLMGALRILAGPPGPAREGRTRRALGRSIFGVDRNAAAVRLAELRLWLEVLAAMPDGPAERVEPLPNLDALVRQGDSLADPATGLPFPPPPAGRAALLAGLRREVIVSNGPSKRAAAAVLAREERALAEAMLSGTIATLETHIAHAIAMGRGPTLFGDRRGLPREERMHLAALRSLRRKSRERLRDIRRTGEVPWFHYPIHFADVFAAGGFDLVVGNPPWVRAESIEPSRRRYLAERYRWYGAGKGRRSGYAHLPDLSIAFLERAFELLAPGGVVGFLLPARLATAGYAARAREALATGTAIGVLADLRADSRAAFDATVYPLAFVAAKRAPTPQHEVRLRLGPAAPAVPQSALTAQGWPLVSDGVRTVIQRLRHACPTLAERFTC